MAESWGRSNFRFWGPLVLISIGATLFYIPTSSLWRFLFLGILTSNCCFLDCDSDWGETGS
jgi:hypothetical protein